MILPPQKNICSFQIYIHYTYNVYVNSWPNYVYRQIKKFCLIECNLEIIANQSSKLYIHFRKLNIVINNEPAFA